MNLDSVLDVVESKPVRTVAFLVVGAVALWFMWRHGSVDARVARVCNGLYRGAQTAAESTIVDTMRTAVRSPDNSVVISSRCGELRLAGRLE